jgi:hypothetical protein
MNYNIIQSTGEWLLFFVHFLKYLGYNKAEGNVNKTFSLSDISLESLYLKDVQYYWLTTASTAYGLYYLIGGFLHVSCNIIFVINRYVRVSLYCYKSQGLDSMSV